MGFSEKAAAAISIIGGADGRHLFSLQVNYSRQHLMGPIAVAAYSYMSLVPIIQPPIMKASDNRRRTKDQDGAASSGSKLEKNPVPDHRNDRSMYDSSDNSSSGRYADAW